MWRNISRPEPEPNEAVVRAELHPFKRSPHHYSVDCAGAHKGLFVGILMLVLTIISLIIFFVLITKPEFTQFAVTEVNICELVLYGSTTIATLVGMLQVRTLHYDSTRSFSLGKLINITALIVATNQIFFFDVLSTDDILLVGAQTGSFLYSTFTIIGAHLTHEKNTILILITAMASLVETAFQTMFILDASRRSAATPDHIRKKPGRELVTFLLVSNLAMWAINTLEKSRAESHPLQLHFYGLWAWTILSHVASPLGKKKKKCTQSSNQIYSNNNFRFQRFSIDFTALFVYVIFGSVHGKWNQLTCKAMTTVFLEFHAGIGNQNNFLYKYLGILNKIQTKWKNVFNLQRKIAHKELMIINNFLLIIHSIHSTEWLATFHSSSSLSYTKSISEKIFNTKNSIHLKWDQFLYRGRVSNLFLRHDCLQQ